MEPGTVGAAQAGPMPSAETTDCVYGPNVASIDGSRLGGG